MTRVAHRWLSVAALAAIAAGMHSRAVRSRLQAIIAVASIEKESQHGLPRLVAEPKRLEASELMRATGPYDQKSLNETLRATLERPVYFDFDRSDLSSEARAALQAKLGLLAASPDVLVRIEGHADDRGSEEYNVALGQRRAAAARRFLTQRGIAPERIVTVSFGEQRPVCSSVSESCWSRNRRAEFVVIGSAGYSATRSDRFRPRAQGSSIEGVRSVDEETRDVEETHDGARPPLEEAWSSLRSLP